MGNRFFGLVPALVLACLLLPRAAAATPAIETMMNSLVVVTASDAGDDDSAPALGSGFVYERGGLILTNAHVVGDRAAVTLVTRSGERRSARVVGRDGRTDIALLAPASPLGLAPLRLARSSRVALGTLVYALGHPLGRRFSATSGIVAGHDRSYDAKMPVGFVQHDAALNPGNSGGPLVTAAGEVLGINTATPRETLFDIGMGFAIPAELVAEVAGELRANGKVARGGLGVMVSSADAAIAGLLGADQPGLLVDRVVAASGESSSGLVAGDLLLALDGRPLRLPRDLSRALLRARAGQQVRIDLVRAGKSETIMALLDPAIEGEKLAARVADLAEHGTTQQAHGLTLQQDPVGVRIAAVAAGSAAEREGLFPGDRLLAINGRTVASAAEAERRLVGPLILLRVVRRDGAAAHVALPLASGQPRTGDTRQEKFSAGPY